MLIARINFMQVMYETHGHQRGYSWHMLNFLHDANETARNVPRLPADFSKIVVVKRMTITSSNEFNKNRQSLKQWQISLKHIKQSCADIETDKNSLNVKQHTLKWMTIIISHVLHRYCPDIKIFRQRLSWIMLAVQQKKLKPPMKTFLKV